MPEIPARRKTLIVVEDDAEMRAMLSETLYQHGFQVFSSADAASACELATALRPAAILCDVVMPTMSGFEAVQRLRENPQTQRIPVILMTGHTYLREEQQHARWLMKPFTTDELAAELQQALN
jgi:CheY-like chemotaxis protein